MKFDINRFYRYYKNKNNLQSDPTKTIYQFYDDHILRTAKKQNYIMINGKKIYVDALNPETKKVIFTIHDPNDPHNWDNHFHFGIYENFSKKSRQLKRANVIYFHKTIQHPHEKEAKRCFFVLDVDIDHIEEIDCVETDDIKMKDQFPIGSEDFTIIKRIIQIPFGIPGGKSYRRNKTRKMKIKLGNYTRRATINANTYHQRSVIYGRSA